LGECKGRVLTIGNILKDRLETKFGVVDTYGGTSYPGLAARRLGYKSRILSRGNEELSEWIQYLNSEGVEVILQDDRTMHFVNNYRGVERKQFLLSRTEKIKIDIDEKYDVIHIDPRFQEVSPDTAERVRDKCKILSMDAQGFVRDIDPKDNSVIGRYLEDTEKKKLLPYVDFLKVSKNEMRFVVNYGEYDYKRICKRLHKMGVGVVAITLDVEGSLIYDGQSDRFHKIPAFKTKTVDETGAGDVYAASFAIILSEGGDVIDAGAFATAAASFTVGGVGTTSIANRNEVEYRANFIKKNILKNNRIKN